MSYANRRAYSLIELLVSLVGASVVLMGGGIILSTSVGDQKAASDWREVLYSRANINTEILWTLRCVPRAMLRQNDGLALRAASTITLNDGGPARTLITYNRPWTPYVGVTAPVFPDDLRRAGDNAALQTGVIWQYSTGVYRYERAEGGNSFRTMTSAALKAFCEDLANIRASELLGVSVQNLDVAYVVDTLIPVVPAQTFMQWNVVMTAQ